MSLNLDFCLQLNEIWDDTVNWSFSYIPISIQIWISIWVPLSNVLYFQKRSTLLNYQLQVSRFVWELALVTIPFCKFCISLHFIRLSSICGPLMSICVGYFFFSVSFSCLFCFISNHLLTFFFFFFNCWSFPAGITMTIKQCLWSDVYPVTCLLYHALKLCSWDWSNSDVIQPLSIGFHLLLLLSHVNWLGKL